MWIRLRLDVGWTDLLAGALGCLSPRSRTSAEVEALAVRGEVEHPLITRSVRSAFDLLLRALELPAGPEVLLSALTVPNTVRIVEAHDLVPVPVDVDGDRHICLTSRRANLSEQSRLMVVAHLFGETQDLTDVIALLSDRKIALMEDCAQTFERPGDHDHPESLAVLYSFGPIKTATALGARSPVSGATNCRRWHEVFWIPILCSCDGHVHDDC